VSPARAFFVAAPIVQNGMAWLPMPLSVQSADEPVT
jgi:hypothetical protein